MPFYTLVPILTLIVLLLGLVIPYILLTNYFSQRRRRIQASQLRAISEQINRLNDQLLELQHTIQNQRTGRRPRIEMNEPMVRPRRDAVALSAYSSTPHDFRSLGVVRSFTIPHSPAFHRSVRVPLSPRIIQSLATPRPLPVPRSPIVHHNANGDYSQAGGMRGGGSPGHSSADDESDRESDNSPRIPRSAEILALEEDEIECHLGAAREVRRSLREYHEVLERLLRAPTDQEEEGRESDANDAATLPLLPTQSSHSPELTQTLAKLSIVDGKLPHYDPEDQIVQDRPLTIHEINREAGDLLCILSRLRISYSNRIHVFSAFRNLISRTPHVEEVQALRERLREMHPLWEHPRTSQTRVSTQSNACGTQNTNGDSRQPKVNGILNGVTSMRSYRTLREALEREISTLNNDLRSGSEMVTIVRFASNLAGGIHIELVHIPINLWVRITGGADVTSFSGAVAVLHRRDVIDSQFYLPTVASEHTRRNQGPSFNASPATLVETDG